MVVKLSQRAAYELLNNDITLNGCMPFDRLDISKDKSSDEIIVAYYCETMLMFTQSIKANLDAGEVVSLPNHLGTVPITVS